MIDQLALKRLLADQGYREIYEWKEPSYKSYPSHKHTFDTVLVILDGEIIITIQGVRKKYTRGMRVEIGAEVVHSAQVGPKGCTYLVGEGKKASRGN